MAASVRAEGGSDPGGCPPDRRHGVLEPPDRSALRDQGNPGLAEVSPPGVAPGLVRTLPVVRVRILPRPVQPRTTPGPLCDLEAARLLAGAARTNVRGRRSPAPQPGARLQRSGQIQTAHRGHGDRGAGARCYHETLRQIWRRELMQLNGRDFVITLLRIACCAGRGSCCFYQSFVLFSKMVLCFYIPSK